MPVFSSFMTNCAGIFHPKLPPYQQLLYWNRFKNYTAIQLLPRRIPEARIQYFITKDFRAKHTFNAGKNYHQLNLNDEYLEEPFWKSLIKEIFGALKSLSLFLLEQPMQLKYIEWPSFQSTLKTATLTLALVALLLVALSSVDSALCYLLALFLRRSS